MITLERVHDMQFQFDILEPKDEFMHLRDLISKKLEDKKEDVSFMSNLLVKINNTFGEITTVIGFGEKDSIKPHMEIIKRIVNNFVFSKKFKYLATNFVLIANSYKELNLFLMRNKRELEQHFDTYELTFLRAILIEISKLEFNVERRL